MAADDFALGYVAGASAIAAGNEAERPNRGTPDGDAGVSQNAQFLLFCGL